ncbi:MAG: hypothetical protein ACQEW7_00035 [Pseudomonadota bacterium]
MSYWFAYRVHQKGIDLNPGTPILEGPFDSHGSAKQVKESIHGSDMQKTSIFLADSKEKAEEQLARETWMV